MGGGKLLEAFHAPNFATTFSTFQLELVRFVYDGHVALASAYLATSLAAGLAAVYLATALTRRVPLR